MPHVLLPRSAKGAMHGSPAMWVTAVAISCVSENCASESVDQKMCIRKLRFRKCVLASVHQKICTRKILYQKVECLICLALN